jgi:hypothetical protein
MFRETAEYAVGKSAYRLKDHSSSDQRDEITTSHLTILSQACRLSYLRAPPQRSFPSLERVAPRHLTLIAAGLMTKAAKARKGGGAMAPATGAISV